MTLSRDHIVIAGGTGFLGQLLAQHFSKMGYLIVILSRHNHLDEKGIRYVQWDGKTLGPWTRELEGAQALINMNGRSVDCRYTPENKEAIYRTRIHSTHALGQAIEGLDNPPTVWLNSSSATIYRHAEDRPMDEFTGEYGHGFSVDVCKKWERAFWEAHCPNTRKIALRTAIVFGKNGGALNPLKTLAKWGLGGKQGSGKQFVSWVHEEDFVRAVEFAIHTETLTGPVNVASPNPLPNAEFMAHLRKAVGHYCGLPSPKWMLEIGARIIDTETELILKSRRVVPAVLTQAGFEFAFTEIPQALSDLLSKKSGSRSGTVACGIA
ncbi:MAG: TIGR01777 family oxidoreductase [Schleiferiaceae bacterium]